MSAVNIICAILVVLVVAFLIYGFALTEKRGGGASGKRAPQGRGLDRGASRIRGLGCRAREAGQRGHRGGRVSDWKVTYTKRRRSVRERLARWYMGRVAGRYCPCEWPIKSKALIRLCGRVDDSVCNADFRDFVHFHLHVHQNQTTSSGGAAEEDA